MKRPKNLSHQVFATTPARLLSAIAGLAPPLVGVGDAVRTAPRACLLGAAPVVFLLVGPASADATAVAPDSPVIHDGASAPAQAWRAAMERGDLPALARMHDAATTAFPPDKTQVAGVDAIMKGYARLFATYTARVTFQDAHWVEQPPLVVSWGLFTLTLHPKRGGPDKVTHGRFTDAAVRTDGGWRYLVDHASLPKT